MSVRRIPIDPPVGRDGFTCRWCGTPIFAVAKVTYDDGQPDWFAYQHGSGEQRCPSKTIAEPHDEVQAHTLVEAVFAVQVTPEGAVAAKSAQAVRVDTARNRLYATEKARREFVAAGDRKAASKAAGAIRGVIEDLSIHDLRSLTITLFLASIRAEPVEAEAARLRATLGEVAGYAEERRTSLGSSSSDAVLVAIANTARRAVSR